MISENNKKFLRKIAFLENFTDEELDNFFSHLEKPIVLPEGNVLITDGTVDKSLYIVLTGQFSIYRKQGQKKIFVAKVNKTEIIGEMSEYVTEKRAVSIMVTTFEARVLKVQIIKYPLPMRLKIRENYCNILAQRLIKKNDDFHKLRGEMANIISSCDEKAHTSERELREEIVELKEKLAEQDVMIKSLQMTSA